MKKRIRLLNEISSVIYESLDPKTYDIGKEINNPDAILVRSADMHEYAFDPNLIAIARAGVGTNNVPVERCNDAGIAVFYAPGANANAVKELLFAGMLLSARDVLGSVDWVKSVADRGADIPKLVEKEKNRFAGPELQGKTLGVIGLGNIGGPVATLATHFHMNVIGFDPFMTVDAAWRVSRAVNRAPSEEALLAESDYVSIHVPLNGDTRGKINAEFIARMKGGAVLLNFSRGEIVDDDAMIAALENGRLRAYVTDFPNEKLIGKKGVIAIPHLGASTPESEENCAVMVADEVDVFLRTGSIRNSVNLPDCELPAQTDSRLTVIHRNVPKMINAVTSAVADAGINIAHMVNRSRGEMAYTVIDLEQTPPPTIVQALLAVDGIRRVRVL